MSGKIPTLPKSMLDHHDFACSSIFASAAVIQSKLHENEILMEKNCKLQ
jgi:hypothetical protein